MVNTPARKTLFVVAMLVSSVIRVEGKGDEDGKNGVKVMYFRHGESAGNAWRVDLGIADGVLTPKGENQARSRIAQLTSDQRAEMLAVDVVLVSPLTRAMQTALALYVERWWRWWRTASSWVGGVGGGGGGGGHSWVGTCGGLCCASLPRLFSRVCYRRASIPSYISYHLSFYSFSLQVQPRGGHDPEGAVAKEDADVRDRARAAGKSQEHERSAWRVQLTPTPVQVRQGKTYRGAEGKRV
jgi:hypothetical protein